MAPALFKELSREERQAARKRGAGRTFVDSNPITFARRKSLKAPLAPVDVNDHLVAIRDVKTPRKERQAEVSRSERKRKSKMMNFATPKTVKKAKTVVSSSTKVNASQEILGDLNTAAVAPTLQRAGTEPLSSSLHQSDRPSPPGPPSPASPDQAEEEVALSIKIKTPARKRKHEETIKQPVKVKTPARKQTHGHTGKPAVKRPRGLLRELGPGASRFIVGAKNYATPEKSRENNAPRRASTRIILAAHRPAIPIRVIKAPAKLPSKKVIKSVKPISDLVLSICVLREMGLTWKSVGEVLGMTAQKASKTWRALTIDMAHRAAQDATQYAKGSGKAVITKGMSLRPMTNCDACRRKTKAKCAGKCNKRGLLVNSFVKSLLRDDEACQESNVEDSLDLLSG
ncbi:hypothetical protein BCR37DRAFT_391082 [Protomyces lactucae-debilis]|uniref:Uncharacterized protein n=1 Tax=Protomyces lactucae-debilis TaxID=2754530 RepID=A0A1Y2FSX6_PROLT|nr:uncharacterized protein BCR37DRAFT_391082 [Protomyces lactucae-debilis]ORY86286.1 hypothetical protein BCR37DRAFT_391082 [Protomyces lactucae-debilis]